MSGLTPQALFNQRENIGKQLRELMSKNNPNNTNDAKFTELGKQWSNLDGKLHKATLEYIHTLLYNSNLQTVKSANNLQKIINGLSKNNFNTNTGPILAMYKSYLERINSNKLASNARSREVEVRLAAEKESLQKAFNTETAALKAQIEGNKTKAAELQAQAKAQIANMQAAHKAALTNMQQEKQLEIEMLEGEKTSLRIQQRIIEGQLSNARVAANQAAKNLAAAKASGNAAAAEAAKLAQNIAKRNLEATERNAQIAEAKAALVKAKANAEAASLTQKAAANKALANKQAEFNRQLAANKAAANKALENARAAAAANKNSVVAKAALNKAAADQAAAEAAQKVSQLEAAVTAGQENKRAALEAAEKAAKEAQAKANQEAANLKRNLAAKSVEANRLAGSLAEASRAGANAEKRFRTQLLMSKETEAKATRAKLATMAAQLEVVKSRGNAAAARKLANAHKAEANAAKQAAISAAEATENAKKVAANRQAAIIALEANVEAGKINKQALINAHTKAAEASAAAVAAAQAEKQAAAEALVALKESSNATQAQLNNARAAINAANANKRATANKHAANMAKLKENANRGTANAIEVLKAAQAANKAAANKALANLKASSAQNVTNLRRALNNLNARRQAELEAKGTEKETAVAAARAAAEAIAAEQLKELKNSLKEAQQQVKNISGQKDSNLNAQKKAAEAQAANLQKQLNMAMKKLTNSQRNTNAVMKKLQENKKKAVAGLREARSTNRNAANAAAKLWLKAYGGPGGVKVPLFNVRKAAREIEKNYPNILKINKNLIEKALSTSLVYQKNQGQLSRATRILKELGLPSGTTRVQGLLTEAGGVPKPKPSIQRNSNSNSNSNSNGNNINNLLLKLNPTLKRYPLTLDNINRLNGIIKNTPNYGDSKWTNDNKFVLNMMNKNKNSNKVKQARKALNNKKSQSMAIVPVGPVMNVPTGGVGGPLSGRNPIEKQALNRFNRVYREYSENGGVTKARWLNLTNAGQLNRLGKYKNRLKLALNNVATNKNRKNKYNKAVANITNRINKIKGKSTVSPKINPSILNTPAPAPASPSLKNRIEQYRKRLQNATNYNNFKKVRNDPNVPRNIRLNPSIRTLISARESQEQKRKPPQKANIRMVGWVSSEKPNPTRKSNKSNYSMKYIDGGYYIQVNGKYRPVLNYNKNTRTARISLLNKNIQGTFKAQKGKSNVLAR